MGGPRVDVPEPAADPSGGEPARGGGALPGAAEVVGQRPGEAQLGVAGDDQPGPAVGGLGVRSFGRVQARVCLNSRKVCSRSNLRRNDCHQRSTSAAVARDDHSHTGLGSRSPGRWSTCRPISVLSMMGSSPWWSSQRVRWVSRGCSRSQLLATAVPQPLTFGLPPPLLFPQRGVLLLGPGQAPAQLTRPAGRAVCAPAATLDTRPEGYNRRARRQRPANSIPFR
jgi:hypothetical protein